jgi:hypothetical protein
LSTQAQTIIDAAIASSLANDAGRSELASNVDELLAVLNRKVQQFYVLAGTPLEQGGAGRGDFFATETNLTLLSTPVALPAAAFRHSFVRQIDGARVSVVPQADIDDGRAEMPPCVLVQQNSVKPTGRVGDPGAGQILTVRYTALPGLLTVATDYIGAATPTNPATTFWPDAAGNPFLVAWLARYLAYKAGDRDADELQAINQDLQEAAQIVGTHVGIEATRLVEDHGGGS